MKLKRFLALAVSLVMVISMIPAFSVTVGAAEAITLFDLTSYSHSNASGDNDVANYGWTYTTDNKYNDWAANLGVTFSTQWSSGGVWNTDTGTPGLMFFSTWGRDVDGNSGSAGTDQTYSARMNDSSASSGATKIIIEYNYATQANANCYQTWTFVDNSGNSIAEMYYDRNVKATAGFVKYRYDDQSGTIDELRGVPFRITIEGKNVTYEYDPENDGTYAQITTETLSTDADGFAGINASVPGWNNRFNAMALLNLKISYEKSEGVKSVAVTYTVNGKTVETKNGTYDTDNNETTASFAELYYRDIDSNLVYYAPAQSLSEDKTIAMSIAQFETVTIPSTVSVGEAKYNVVGENEVQNPSFETTDNNFSVKSWYSASKYADTTMSSTFANNGTSAHAFKVGVSKYYYINETISDSNGTDVGETYAPYDDWSFGSRYNDGVQGLCSLFNNFIVESGKKYYVSFKAKATGSDCAQIYVGAVSGGATSTPVDNPVWAINSFNAGEWTDFSTVVETGDSDNAIQFNAYYLGNNNNNGAQPYFMFDQFVVVEVEDVATNTEVIVTYTVGGTEVASETKTYDAATADGATFDGFGYSANGSNLMYCVEGNTYSSDTTVELNYVENDNIKSYTAGATYETDAGDYTIKNGKNLIPNGNFKYGLAGWYIGANGVATTEGRYITDSATGTIMAASNTGTGGVGSLYRAWEVEPGSTYVLTFTASAELANAQVTTRADIADTGHGSNVLLKPVLSGENEIMFTVPETDNYVQVHMAWSGGQTFSNFSLYELEPQYDSYYVTVTGADSNDYSNVAVEAFSVDEVEVPYFSGYIFKSRSVSGNNITFTYEATENTDLTWAIRNNVTENTYVTQMKFLGTHNAFANTSSVEKNEGGALYGDSYTSGSSLYVSQSRTQTLGVLDQLNAGVRYFDIRLSRQNDGTFWTIHGPAFAEFRPILVTIEQWAKEHPGEIIILDFHTVRDALYTTVIDDGDGGKNGEKAGDDNEDVWGAITDLLEDTGIWAHTPAAGQSNWDIPYGDLIKNRDSAVILPFAKNRGWQCNDRFIDKSAYSTGDTTYNEERDYDGAVSYINEKYSNLSPGAKLGIIHAYATPIGNLINAANNCNSDWIGETNFAAWMGRNNGDVLLMNNVTEEIGTLYIEALSRFNRDGFDEYYGNEKEEPDYANGYATNGVTLTGANTILPYSTEFRVTTAANTASYKIDGVTYKALGDYTLDFLQYDSISVSLTGNATFTFDTPNDPLKTYTLILSDGTTFGESEPGGDLAVTAQTGKITVTLAETDAPGADMTINYVDGDKTILTVEKFVVYGYEAYNLPAGKFWIANDDNTDSAIIESVAQSYTVTEAVDSTANTVNVPVTLVEEYAVLEDAFVTSSGDEIWGANSADTTNRVLVSANRGTGSAETFRGVDKDADGASLVAATPGDLGGTRTGLMQFPVVELGANEAAIAVLPVDAWHGNTWSNGNTSIRLSAYAMNTSEWTNYDNGTVYNPADSTKLLVAEPIFSTWNTSATTEVKFDVTEFMQAAKAAGMDSITIRLAANWGGCYFVQTEYAVAGGSQAGRAAYIDVVEANTVSVLNAASVTKMGSAVVEGAESIVVPVGDTIRVRETSSTLVAFTDGEEIYVTNADGYAIITPSATGAEYYPAAVGANMVNGAQVRIGDGVNSDGKVTSESGLRFISTLDTRDSVAYIIKENYYKDGAFTSGYEIGVKVTAEGGSDSVHIPATKWQSETVYTSALTNLAVTNFNRTFTTVPYVKIGETYIYNDASTAQRSIYQVAAGLLTNDMVDSDLTGDNAYPEAALKAKRMIDVLNAYVNQTGIRLTLADTDADEDKELTVRTEGTGAYSGDAFFTVSDTTVNGTVYTVTLTASGDKTVFNDYWKEYIRINNNNSVVVNGIDVTSAVSEDGKTLTLTFDASKATK